MTKYNLLFYCLFAFVFSLWLADRPKGIIPVTHYRLADIQSGISTYPPNNIGSNTSHIIGGIIPHHLVAERELARYFQNLSTFPYTRVILLGPNHNNEGDSPAITTDYSWETPYGLVHPDKLPPLPYDDQVMRNDHALEVVMPYLRLYLPRARVIPVLIKASTTKEELSALAKELLPLITPTTLILVSTDFSHYLSVENAEKHDQTTLKILESRDYKELLSLSDSNLDSPPSVFVLLSLLPSAVFDVFTHTSAATLTNNSRSATTTHYFLNFYASK